MVMPNKIQMLKGYFKLLNATFFCLLYLRLNFQKIYLRIKAVRTIENAGQIINFQKVRLALA